MIQLPKVLTGYFSTSKLNSAFTLIENWFNNNVIHRKNGSAVMEQTLDMNGNPIINTAVGTDPTSLVNRAYVDRVLPGLEQLAAASETSAANSAAAAAISEINAANSEQNALTYLREFRGTYFGAYASEPTTDPDGNPVNTGDLYFDTNLNEMRVYDGLFWKPAGQVINGIIKRFHFKGDGITTRFEIPGGYYPTFADVFVNGVKLINGVDVGVLTGTDIVFATAPANDDDIDVIAYGTFRLADVYTKAEIDASIYKKSDIDSGTVVLNAIKNVDGHNSGLDADTLDGKHSTCFVEIENLLHEIHLIDGHGSGINADTLDGMHASEFMQIGDFLPTILNIGGEGSGIDADLLDGKDSTKFVEKVNLLSEITAIDGSGSGLDADLIRGLPADFSNSMTYNGYQKFPSGLIIQWGSYYGGGTGPIDIVFPITFPNAVLLVLFGEVRKSENPTLNTSVTSVTERGFVLKAPRGELSWGFSERWIAIGH